MRQQRTLRHAISCAGVGLHSGAGVAVTLRPAVESSGIRFRRVDRPGSPAIAASPGNALVTDGVTTLATAAGGSVRMVEHLMAALAACEIDNVLVETSGAELPVMDGSAQAFVLLVECAGTVEQGMPVTRLEILRPVEVTWASARARLEPSPGLEIVVESVDGARVPDFAFTVSPEICKREVVGARDRNPFEFLRGVEERVRHLALDALGTLALVPAALCGRYIECNASPALRCRLLREVLGDRRNWHLTGRMPDREEWLGPPLAWAS